MNLDFILTSPGFGLRYRSAQAGYVMHHEWKKSMYLKKILLLTLIYLCTSCNSLEKFNEPVGLPVDQLAQLHFYRTYLPPDKDIEKPYLLINDKIIGKLGAGVEKTVKLEKGIYKLSIKESFLSIPAQQVATFDIEVSEKEEYYIRFSRKYEPDIHRWKLKGFERVDSFYTATKEEYMLRK